MISRSLVVHVITVYLHYSKRPLNEQLWWAAYYGHTGEVVRLFRERADPNWQDEEGRTAVHVACLYNHHQTLSVLIGQHANINIKDRKKYTPLHIACRDGYFECVSLLGADCDSG